MPFSVLIIIKNRHNNLLNVLEGISASTLQPAEVIIVHMNEPTVTIDTQLPIRQIILDSKYALPLAAARNLAAEQARYEQLIFLDVDCIPAADCFLQLLTDLGKSDLVMADPRYLTRPVTTIDYAQFQTEGRGNPARATLQRGDSNNYEMFWSLGFAIRKTDFIKIDGFDEQFIGYGGEDTDFAFRARQHNLRLHYSQATVYHQDHPSYDPPLNWLEDIIVNAQRFKEVWGIWPMQGWLTKFKDMGYITWSNDTLAIKRLPTQDEIDAARKPSVL